MIVVENLSKSYGGSLAVDCLSFTVSPGEVLGLVGPNGAGKTTTLRTLSGIITPSAGRVQVAGFDIEKDPVQVKRNLAYVPDDPQLFPDLTVSQHLAFIASAYRVADADAKCNSLIGRFDLQAKRDVPAGDLSRGMKQKLAICCAYLYEPKAILLDEPMTGLDPHGIRELKASVSQRAERGAAVIVSSHLLAMVEDFCTHLLILDRGKLRRHGTLAEVKSAFAEQGMPASLEDVFFRATADCEVTACQ